MSSPDITRIKEPSFEAQVAFENKAICLHMTGTADLRVKTKIDAMLKEVHRAAQQDFDEVIVNLREMDFINSSCFKSFLSWVGWMRSLDAPASYRLRFLANPVQYWQRNTLEALRSFAADLIDIEE